MKKIISLILIFSLLFVFGSCKSDVISDITTEPDDYSRESVAVTDEKNSEFAVTTDEDSNSDAETTAFAATTVKASPTTQKVAVTTTEKAAATTKKAVTTTKKASDSVTLFISCKTVLSNMNKLKKGKEYFVPSDGVILKSTKVEISDGDTAFDVLKKMCTENEIQLEYSFSAAFSTYYIEGINQLYEKDCGSKSGWVYKVNGSEPGVGCSGYTLSAGDSVEFLYTCDIGEDL